MIVRRALAKAYGWLPSDIAKLTPKQQLLWLPQVTTGATRPGMQGFGDDKESLEAFLRRKGKL